MSRNSLTSENLAGPVLPGAESKEQDRRGSQGESATPRTPSNPAVHSESSHLGVVKGYRHDATCICGCQFVVGEEGRLVIDSDTLKLGALGLGYYEFTTESHGVRIVCFDREAA